MERLSEMERSRRANVRGAVVEPSDLGKRYAAFVADARRKAEVRLERLAARERYERYLLARAREESRETSLLHERHSTPATRAHAQELSRIECERARLMAEDPDAFFVHHAHELAQDLRDQEEGRLINVGYVSRARRAIASSLDAGIPVYLVGHLGSGKTQLAVEAAGDHMRTRAMNGRLAQAMEAWQAEHPDASYDERCDYFNTAYQAAATAVTPQDLRPYLVSGSHNLTPEDLFSEKSLKLSHAGAGSGPDAQLSKLMQSFLAFLDEQRQELDKLDRPVKDEVIEAAWKTYSDLYVAEQSGYGTTVEKVDKEVLLALKEGRPVIIDEMNAIAMPNLIALNDILQHHAGQDAYVAGVGMVKIKPGFCLIGTGNLSTQQVSYEGTNALNPAFQSRFTTIVYNYVPQETQGTLADRNEGTPSELFRLMVEHLCERDGSLDIPDAGSTLEQLWQLAELARMSQNLFEGVSELGASADTPTLSEAVLSIRNLMHVLDFWNQGEECDLSAALWEAFLSTVTNADDRNLLLGLAARYGFFTEADGWSIPARGRGEAALAYEDIRTAPYAYEAGPLEHLSVDDVVYLLFGNGPARTSLPDELAAEIRVDGSVEQDISVAEDVARASRELSQGERVLGGLFPEQP
jgi:MoxR-like ATPase